MKPNDLLGKVLEFKGNGCIPVFDTDSDTDDFIDMKLPAGFKFKVVKILKQGIDIQSVNYMLLCRLVGNEKYEAYMDYKAIEFMIEKEAVDVIN